MLESVRDGSAQTIVDVATLRFKLPIKLPISPSNGILTLGQPVLAQTVYRQEHGRVAIRVTCMKPPEQSPTRKVGFDP